MKILVIGGSGLIGSVLCGVMRNKHEVMYTYHDANAVVEGCEGRRLDATIRKDVFSLIERERHDVVIHASAIASVDVCEDDKENAYKLNVEATRNVADACNKTRAKMVFMSSAAVFDGSKDSHKDEDERIPLNYYGETKVEAEDIVASAGVPFIVARIDMPYGWERTERKNNIVLALLGKMNSGEDVQEISDRFVNPTYMRNLAEVLQALLEKKREGFYNIAGADYLSRYDFAVKVAEAFGKKTQIKSIRFSETASKVPRSNVNLDSSKSERDSGIKLLGVEEGLKRMIEEKGQ